MDIPMLYALAEKENIGILRFPLPNTGSMSVMDEGGRCSIGMDPGVLDGGALERVHLGHELGHCVTGSFYSRSSACDVRERHEYRADKWAVHALLPRQELERAVKEGCTEVWELAERFGLTEDFIRRAAYVYRCEEAE